MVSKHDLARLRSTFFEALSLSEPERRSYAERRLVDDPESQALLLAMLEAHHDAVVDVSVSRIGRYRVVGSIARGGSGNVLEAIEPPPLSRRVALKLLRVDLPSEEAAARFERECERLARMTHPGIARILDAGMLTSRRPWFSMEFVDGVPIDAFVEQERPDARTRADLFLQVCDAVQHAHDHGVLHLGLGPANVLVLRAAACGPGPRTRVVDFDVGLGPVRSGRRGRSPEQQRGDHAGIGVRSDVWALGALLGELMFGSSWRETDEPGELAPGLDSTRASELAAVVRMAAAAEPARRYPSVAALVDDVRRVWSEDASPVLDGGWPRLRARAGRFVRARGLAVGVVLAAVTLAFAAGSTRDADAAAERGAFEDVLTLADGRRAPDGAARARRVSSRLDHLGFAPAVEAELRELVGRQLWLHLRPAAAEEELWRALELNLAEPAPDRGRVASVTRLLTTCRLETDSRRVDDLAALTLLGPAIADVDERVGASVAALAASTDADACRTAVAALSEQLAQARLGDRARLAIADALAVCARRIEARDLASAASVQLCEVELRRAAEPRSPLELPDALLRLAASLALEGRDRDAREHGREATRLLRELGIGDGWREAFASSVLGACDVLSGDRSGFARCEAMVSAELPLPPTSWWRRRAWRLALVVAAGDSEGASEAGWDLAAMRRRQAAALTSTEDPPIAWRPRALAWSDPSSAPVGRMRAFDGLVRGASKPASRLDVDTVLAAASQLAADDPSLASLVADQCSAWCSWARALDPEARIRLASTALELCGDAASLPRRRALLELARAQLYAGDHAAVVDAARAIVDLDTAHGAPPLAVASLYPRSLLAEALVAGGAREEGTEVWAQLVADTRAGVHPWHPFRIFVERTATDAAASPR